MTTTQAYTVRAALLGAYAQAARDAGLEPMRKLRQAGLPATVLDNPDLEVPANRVVELLRDSAAASGREDFALQMAAAYKLSMMGTIGLLARQQPTLRQALEVLQRYRTTSRSVLEFSLDHRGETCIIHLTRRGPAGAADNLISDLAVGFLFRIVETLMGPGWRPRMVHATRAAPIDPAPYEQILGKVAFGQDYDGVEILTSELAQPLPAADADMAFEIARYLEQTCHNDRAGLVDRVEDLVRRLLPGGQCSIEEVASHLGVNRRTLHRQLARDGLTFVQLVERVRHSIVKTRMNAADGSLGDLAERLGFSSLSTFSRWFRASYGCCARRFRMAA